MSGMGRLRRFDLGNKAIDSSVFDSSILGVIVTIASVSLIVILLLSELILFMKTETSSQMAIADFHEHDSVEIRLHVTFPYIDCEDLEVIAENARGGDSDVDASGVQRLPATKADTAGFKKKGGVSGCTIEGTLEVARAGGSIHVHVMHHDPTRVVLLGPGKIGMTNGERRSGPQAVAGVNVTHRIHDLGFGPAEKLSLGESRNPLAGSAFMSETGPGQVRYSLKVVPISHKRMHGIEARTHTYASNVGFVPESDAMSSGTTSKQWLGVDFEYDFSPIMVRYTESRKSLFEFITSVCAIVGGIYTVSGLLVRGLTSVSRKKMD